MCIIVGFSFNTANLANIIKIKPFTLIKKPKSLNVLIYNKL